MNESRETTPEDYNSLEKFTISNEWETEFIGSTVETDYKGNINDDTVIQREFEYLTVDKRFFKKSLQRGPSKAYLPLLYSEGKNISKYDRKCRIYMIYYNRKEKNCVKFYAEPPSFQTLCPCDSERKFF